MVKILQPRRVIYEAVSSPSVVTTLLFSATIATYFLESSWKYKPIQRQYIDLVVSIIIYKYWLVAFYLLLHIELPFAPTLWRQRLK